MESDGGGGIFRIPRVQVSTQSTGLHAVLTYFNGMLIGPLMSHVLCPSLLTRSSMPSRQVPGDDEFSFIKFNFFLDL